MTRIVKVEEKYYTGYFDVTTDEQLHKVALSVLQRRFDDGYYTHPGNEPSLGFTMEDVERMPVAIQEEMRKRVQDLERELRLYRNREDEYQEIVDTLTNNDGKMAVAVLGGRSRCEYEGFNIFICDEVPE